MQVPSTVQHFDPAEAARRRQLAVIAARVRVSPSVAALVAAHAFGVASSWQVAAEGRR